MSDISRRRRRLGAATCSVRPSTRSSSRSCVSREIASRIGVGLTPRRAARPRSVTRSPGASSPEVTMPRKIR
nr:hypothetical protein [Trebonia kvetii]